MPTMEGLKVEINVSKEECESRSSDPLQGKKDEMEWLSFDEATTVHFLDADPTKSGHNGSPFKQGAFHVPKGGTVSSGPILEEAMVCDCDKQQFLSTITTSTRSWAATRTTQSGSRRSSSGTS